jgi:2-C-methyl-D-erythritol 2,4-cyclodiphosphate synthase
VAEVSVLRVGLGVDLHRREARDPVAVTRVEPGAPTESSQPSGRPLVLGGVLFPGERALVGHSDADVVAHAVADAMLGGAGLGDLGTHFDDRDERWLGADSLVLLEATRQLLHGQGWRLVNADCTIVVEAPRVGPSKTVMSERLSHAAGGPVHVKATSPEGLGSLGRLEGIACVAIAMVESDRDDSRAQPADRAPKAVARQESVVGEVGDPRAGIAGQADPWGESPEARVPTPRDRLAGGLDGPR